MDRIDNVAVFAEVAERGSFAEAARHLNRSPAAVTRAVAELEARLGVRLLNRTTRAVSVTEPGQRFLAGARRVLADLTEIEQAAIGQGSAPRGELRLTAPIVFGRRHVLPLVTDFLAEFPEVSVRLTLARPAGRSGRGGPRRRDPDRGAGRYIGDRDAGRGAAADRGRRARLPQAPRPAEDAARACRPRHHRVLRHGRHRALAFCRRRRGADQAAADRQHRGGRDRCGGRGLRHHPRAELSGGRRAVGQVAGPDSCATTRATTSRSMCFIPMAGIRRRSSAPFSMCWCRGCGQRCERIAKAIA